jgi:aspartokinase
METTAAYRESRIKTYGFQKVTDLSLVEVTAVGQGMESLGSALYRLGELGIEFHLVFSGLSSEKGPKSYLLMGRERETILSEFMGERGLAEPRILLRVTSPVELVFFHGPHFADRYGILDASLQALAAKGLNIMASACSGSCVYLVVPGGKADETASALSEAFDVPKVVRPLHRESHVST